MSPGDTSTRWWRFEARLTRTARRQGGRVDQLWTPTDQGRCGAGAWAAKELSGSNGIIGLDGCSFLGIDQIFTAAALGPNSPVKEILPACASNNYNTYFAGGIPVRSPDCCKSLGQDTHWHKERDGELRRKRGARAPVPHRGSCCLQRHILAGSEPLTTWRIEHRQDKSLRSFGADGIRPTDPDHSSSMRSSRTLSTIGLPSAR